MLQTHLRSSGLALLVTVSALPAGTAYAAQNISKEEVVYVN